MGIEKVDTSPEDLLIPWEDTEYNLTQNSVAGGICLYFIVRNTDMGGKQQRATLVCAF